MKYGFSRVKVLTPRAETNLRLGQKSLKPIRVQFEHSPAVSAVLCFTMRYPTSPLILESVQCSSCSSSSPAEDITTEDSTTDSITARLEERQAEAEALQARAEQTLRDFALSRTDTEEGYAVQFTELFATCQWPGDRDMKQISNELNTTITDADTAAGGGADTKKLASLEREDDRSTREETQDNEVEHNCDDSDLDNDNNFSDLCSTGIANINVSIFCKDEQEAPLDTTASSSPSTTSPPAVAVTAAPKSTTPDTSLSPLSASGSVSASPSVGTSAAPYKCRKCRSIIFTSAGLAEPHFMTPRATATTLLQSSDLADTTTSSSKKKKSKAAGQVLCRTLLLDPDRVSWVQQLAKASPHIADSLSCPHCSCKLGVFDWSGAKCGCGQWVAPSFKITDSKVDMPPQR